ARQAEELLEQVVLLLDRDGERPILAEQGDPLERCEVAEPGHPVFDEDEPSVNQKDRFFQGQPLLAAAQLALEEAAFAGAIACYLQPVLPRLAIIPVEGPQRGIVYGLAQAAPTG